MRRLAVVFMLVVGGCMGNGAPTKNAPVAGAVVNGAVADPSLPSGEALGVAGAAGAPAGNGAPVAVEPSAPADDPGAGNGDCPVVPAAIDPNKLRPDPPSK